MLRQIGPAILLAVCVAACTVTPAGSQQVLVMVDRAGNQIATTAAGSTTVLDVYSERGIGRADVRLLAGDYPERIVLRFHLRGLEELRFSYGTMIVTVSLPSSGTLEVRESRVSTGPTAAPPQAIAPDSPYWMDTTVAAPAAGMENPIPLTEGWIEVELPPDFLQGRYTGFSIQWIDFFR